MHQKSSKKNAANTLQGDGEVLLPPLPVRTAGPCKAMVKCCRRHWPCTPRPSTCRALARLCAAAVAHPCASVGALGLPHRAHAKLAAMGGQGGGASGAADLTSCG